MYCPILFHAKYIQIIFKLLIKLIVKFVENYMASE